MKLLNDLNADHADASDEAMGRMRHAVLNGTAHAAPVRRDGVLRRRPVLSGAVAGVTLAALLTGAVVSASALDDGGNRPRAAAPVVQGTAPDSTKATGLELAAQHATQIPAMRIRPGQFLYHRIEGTATGGRIGPDGTMQVTVITDNWAENWLDPNGMLAVHIKGDQGKNPRVTVPGTEELARQYHLLDPRGGPWDSRVSRDNAKGYALAAGRPTVLYPTPEYLATLPTDPDALLAVIQADALAAKDPQADIPESAVGVIQRLFTRADPILSPELRSALYRALAKLPGYREAGQVQFAGRTGISFAFGDPTATFGSHEIILDATTYRFMGTRNGAGTPTEMVQIVTANTVVDSLG